MAFKAIRKPFDKLRRLGPSTESSRTSSAETRSREKSLSAPPSGNGSAHPKYRDPEDVAAERRKKGGEQERKKAAVRLQEAAAKRRDEKFLEEGPDESTRLFRPLSMNMSKRREYGERFLFEDLEIAGMFSSKSVIFRQAALVSRSL
jgi:aspartyl-tRNA synthetase